MKIDAKLLEKVSEKNGKKYVVIEVYLSPTYKKTMFISNPELEIIKLANTKQ